MSIESLVLFVVFIALPLIQQLLQAKRQRDARASRPPERPPMPAPAREATFEKTPEVAHHTAYDEAVDETFEEMPDETLAGAREELSERGAPPMPEIVTPAPRALMPQPSVRRHAAVAGLRDRHDLRRAIVLTTILGSCRALTPYESPERR